jgi:xanthine dehydrogenase iron-sulfur cluster and FAD-binding subunit A
MWKHYYTATDSAEALRLLAEHAGHARLIAGGTDLLIELERGLRRGIDTLIDISRLTGLNRITLENDRITLGALVTHNDVVASRVTVDHALPLAQAAWEVGAPQIRNRGTIAGNVITASPANDTITPLWALDASVTLASIQGERTLSFPEFYTGFRKTALQPDEMLTAIHFQPLAANERGMFIKLGLRRAQAISVVNIAAILVLEDNIVTRARIALGSVAPTIIRLPVVEALLQGQALTPETIREAAHLAGSIPTPIDDVRSTAEYRSEMIRVLTARALRTLAAGEERSLWPADAPLLHTPQPIQPAQKGDVAHRPITTTINGKTITRATGQEKTLLRFLREDCGLPGTKEGCAEGECGACTVFLDGAAVMACMIPAPRADHAEIVTVEGVGSEGNLHPVQQAFIDAGAVQCGYCTPGFIMAGAKLLQECPQPTRAQVEQSITGNLCRCTGYYKIIDAVQNAAQLSSNSEKE